MRKLRFLFVFVFCLFFSFSVRALDIYSADYSKSDVKVFERTEKNNWGVNKKWNIDSANLSNVKSMPYVDASDKVYDFANILSDSEEKQIYNSIISFIEKYDMDMIFVTSDFSYSSDIKNDDYAADFYDYNDFGINYDHYDGIIIFRNSYDKDPYYLIRFFGQAQLYYNQDRLDNLLDDIYDLIHSGQYAKGVDKAISIISKDIDRGIPYSNKHKHLDDMNILVSDFYVSPFCFVGAAGITFIVMLIMIKKNKMVRKATTAGQYLNEGSINYTQKVDQFTHSHTTHYTISSSSGGGGGGHIGSSGGGSFGGGRHG